MAKARRAPSKSSARSKPAKPRARTAGARTGRKAAVSSNVRKAPPRAPVAGRDKAGRGAKFAIEAARLLGDLRCTDIQVLDVRGKSGMTDYLVVGSGTSDRQMRSVADSVADLGAQMDHPAFRTDADTRSTWLVLDCVDVVVHLFEPSTRTYYDIEAMWGDAPRLDWARARGETARGEAAPARRSVTRYEDGGTA